MTKQMTSKRALSSLSITAAIAGLGFAAQATIIVVPGTSDPWLAGQPNGTTASWEDSAPGQSPVYAGSVTPGSTLTWSANGNVGHPGDPADPNGALYGWYSHSTGAENGISDVYVPIDCLLGVFLGPNAPSGAAPASLDFSSIGLTYGTLSPLVDQVFYMGDGSAQSVVVPTGATRLYLGTMDGYGWWNNTGAFSVDLQGTVVGVPDGGSSVGLLGIALGLLAAGRRKLS
jgi:hypothetical protein